MPMSKERFEQIRRKAEQNKLTESAVPEILESYGSLDELIEAAEQENPETD